MTLSPCAAGKWQDNVKRTPPKAGRQVFLARNLSTRVAEKLGKWGECCGKCRCSSSSRSHKMPGTHKMPTLPPTSLVGLGWVSTRETGAGGKCECDKQWQQEKRRMCGPKASAFYRCRGAGKMRKEIECV